MTQQINLIDAGVLASRRRSTTPLLLGLVGATALGVAAHYAVEKTLWDRTAAAAAAAEANTAAAPAADAIDAELARAQEQLALDEAMRHARATLIDATRDTAPRLASVVAALPGSSWLKQVDFVGARGMRIVGGSLNGDDLARYSLQLAKDKAFAGLPIHALHVEQQATAHSDGSDRGGPRSYAFELSSLPGVGDTP